MYSVYGCFYATIQCFWLSETVSETYCNLSTTIERPAHLSTLTSAQRITISILLYILNMYNIIIVMKKKIIKFMQEFTSAIDIECLNSRLQAKLLKHNCTRAKHVFVAYK